jgi:arginine N-succinyltransferase
MAGHLKRFAKETIAELRGYLNDQDQSPFWNAIGSHFFPMDYPRADALSMIDKQFIEDLMPRYPIYLELLPEEAIDAIGQVHEQAKPASALLKKQGFTQRDLIDIFDGGAVMHCPTAEIDSIRSSRVAQISDVRSLQVDAPECTTGLVTCENPRFHCVLGKWQHEANGIVLDEAAAQLLNAHPGASVRLLAT